MNTSMNDAQTKSKIPVTILTGFLGAGKTTLLNYILRENHGQKIAVIENEFGEVGIDGDLVIADSGSEEIYEMVNGCVCCTVEVRDDLIRVMRELVARPDPLDHILIETSGMADPSPVAQSFFIDGDSLGDDVELDAIVTMVDAKNVLQHLDDSQLDGRDNQAVNQLICADRVVINKIDLVDQSAITQLSGRIRHFNTTADIVTSSYAQLDLSKILGIGAFEPEAANLDDELTHHVHGHEHDNSVTSFSVTADRDIDLDAFKGWIEELTSEQADNLYRMKGIMAVKDEDRRFVFQGVHSLTEFRAAQPWNANEARASKVVFIGRDLNTEALRKRFQECVV